MPSASAPSPASFVLPTNRPRCNLYRRATGIAKEAEEIAGNVRQVVAQARQTLDGLQLIVEAHAQDGTRDEEYLRSRAAVVRARQPAELSVAKRDGCLRQSRPQNSDERALIAEFKRGT